MEEFKPIRRMTKHHLTIEQERYVINTLKARHKAELAKHRRALQTAYVLAARHAYSPAYEATADDVARILQLRQLNAPYKNKRHDHRGETTEAILASQLSPLPTVTHQGNMLAPSKPVTAADIEAEDADRYFEYMESLGERPEPSQETPTVAPLERPEAETRAELKRLIGES